MYKIETNRGNFYYDQTRNQFVKEADKDMLCPNPATFFDQKVNVGNYGYSFNENVYSPEKIQVLEISLGLRCNYECKHCFQTKERESNDYVEGNPDMVEPLIDKLRNANLFNLCKIDLWGGEPFVYWKTLIRLVPKLRSLYPNVMIRIVTNGSVLTKEMVDFCFVYGVQVEISMDANHNDLRITPVEKDNFDVLFYAFQHHGFKAKPTITPSNCNVDECFDYIRTKFNRNMPIVGRGIIRGTNEENFKHSKFTKEQLDTLAKTVYDAGIFHMHTSIHSDVERYKTRIERGATPYESTGICGTPVCRQMMINMRGDVLRCHQNCGKDEIIGNLENIFDGKHTPIKFYSWWERPKCLQCIHVASCGGGCPRQSPEAHENYCEARKAYFDGIMRLFFKFYYDAEVLSVTEC